MNAYLINKEKRIKEIYDLIMLWVESGISMPAFSKIVGVSSKTLSVWKSRFTVGSASCDEEWMKLGGVIDYKPIICHYNINQLKSKWLEYCQNLESSI